MEHNKNSEKPSLDQVINQLNDWYHVCRDNSLPDEDRTGYITQREPLSRDLNQPSVQGDQLAEILEQAVNTFSRLTKEKPEKFNKDWLNDVRDYLKHAEDILSDLKVCNEHQGLDEFYHIHNEKDKNSYSWYEIEKTIWILRQYKNLIQKENEK